MAIYINTNQNVQINYEISSIGDRLIAYLIDSLVITGFAIGVVFIGIWISSDKVTFLMFGIIFFYHLVCEITMNGQSVGKRNRGIRVMKKDGKAATISSYLLRFLLRPIDSIYGLGLAVVFFTNNNQRIGDLAAGTIVVNIKQKSELKEQIKREMNPHKFEDIKYTEAGILTDHEIQLIRTILTKRVKSKNHSNINELAKKIASKIDVKLKNTDDYYFLERVVSDYYKIHST